ncbi:MAG: nucleotidyltransferase domain-containing protein [Lachnospiraceae bacterium]|nr:nucleotidyltransferase domain-containing protein [Lachnospiraceae bacterium]
MVSHNLNIERWVISMTSKMIDDAMKDLAVEAQLVYGKKLKEVILFGSCARGDFENDSDVDVMILIDTSKEKIEEENDKIHPIIHKLDRKYNYNLLFSPIVKSYSEFNYWCDIIPFYNNVNKEGVRYA